MGILNEFPVNVLISTPSLRIIGKDIIIVTNHKGIGEYKDNIIKIRSKIGLVCIAGDKLKITEINIEDITVTGKINRVYYE